MYRYTVVVTLQVEERSEDEAHVAVRRRLNHGYQYGDGVCHDDTAITKTVLIDDEVQGEGDHA